jgi:hypothetical protein
MSSFNFLSYEDCGETLHLTINRPPYNVLDISVMEEISAALDLAIENSTAKVLLITGNDDKTFPAGVDVVDHMPNQVIRMIAVFHGIIKRLMTVPIPTVAAINGRALGGGCELAMVCDMVVASETAELGHPEIKLGVFSPIGTIMLPRQTPMTKAMELLLGGGIISISSKVSERVSPLNPISKRSWFWGSVELWSEGGAVGNGIVVIHGKTARFAHRRAVHKSIDRPLAVVPCKPRARLPSQLPIGSRPIARGQSSCREFRGQLSRQLTSNYFKASARSLSVTFPD